MLVAFDRRNSRRNTIYGRASAFKSVGVVVITVVVVIVVIIINVVVVIINVVVIVSAAVAVAVAVMLISVIFLNDVITSGSLRPNCCS